MLPKNLPVKAATVKRAEYPALYVAAKTALHECMMCDEVKDVSSWARAMAIYAKEARDHEMLDMANRIKLRAERRIGELIQQMPDIRSTGGKKGKKGRLALAREQGVTGSLYIRSARSAKIPPKEFDALVEGPNPPTVSSLFTRTSGITEATNPVIGLRKAALLSISNLGRFQETHPVEDVIRTFNNPSLARDADVLIRKVKKWLDELSEGLQRNAAEQKKPESMKA